MRSTGPLVWSLTGTAGQGGRQSAMSNSDRTGHSLPRGQFSNSAFCMGLHRHQQGCTTYLNNKIQWFQNCLGPYVELPTWLLDSLTLPYNPRTMWIDSRTMHTLCYRSHRRPNSLILSSMAPPFRIAGTNLNSLRRHCHLNYQCGSGMPDLTYTLPSELLHTMVNFSERTEVVYIGAKTFISSSRIYLLNRKGNLTV